MAMRWLKIYFVLTTLFFLARVIVFVNQYGGVEHDSGWYLGVARNLAERGIYASYTNTITEEGKGAYPSIHGRFSVQDENGFSYFPAGVTVGPGYVIPEAFILKLFGYGFWQYRAWPLISFTGLLMLLFYFTWVIGGFISLLILQVWLWATPQLYITYAFEAFSEHTAVFYTLLSFLMFYLSKKFNNLIYFRFLSGIFLSFSYLTKNLSALTLAAFLPIFIFEVFTCRKKVKSLVVNWFVFFCGLAIPIILFEYYRYFYLISHFGIEGWETIQKDIRLHFQSGGSGVTNLNNFDWTFISKKINLWSEIGIKQNLLFWILFFTSPIIITLTTKGRKLLLISLFFFSSLSILSWFVLISPTGWIRHDWIGILTAMVLVSCVIGLFINLKFADWNKKVILDTFILLFILTIVRFDKIEISPFLNKQNIDHWRITRYKEGLQGLPSSPIFSLTDQKETIEFFKNFIKEKDRIYYLYGYLVSEMSPLVDKVFYPFDRYKNLNFQNPDGGGSFLIFGPYQEGPETLVPLNHISIHSMQYCEKTVLSNPSYVICRLKPRIIPLILTP